jgi:hypothetical protein
MEAMVLNRQRTQCLDGRSLGSLRTPFMGDFFCRNFWSAIIAKPHGSRRQQGDGRVTLYTRVPCVVRSPGGALNVTDRCAAAGRHGAMIPASGSSRTRRVGQARPVEWIQRFLQRGF